MGLWTWPRSRRGDAGTGCCPDCGHPWDEHTHTLRKMHHGPYAGTVLEQCCDAVTEDAAKPGGTTRCRCRTPRPGGAVNRVERDPYR